MPSTVRVFRQIPNPQFMAMTHPAFPCVVLALVATLSTTVRQGSQRDLSALSPEELQALQVQVMTLAQPGPEHELLAHLEGEWDQEVRMWMTPTAEEPLTVVGTSVGRRILGGRFLQLESSSNFMGTRTESMNILGFDRRHEHFTQVGFDTMGTYSVAAAGPRDPETGLIEMVGEDVDPIMGVTQRYKFVWRAIEPNHNVMEIVFLDGSHGNDGPYKMVEVVSTRRPAVEGATPVPGDGK